MKHKKHKPRHLKLMYYMEEAKVGRTEFAELIGITPAALHHWIYGTRKPDNDSLALLRYATGNYFSWDDFYGSEVFYG